MIHLVPVLIPLTLVLAGCPGAEAPASCTDATCRQQALIAAFDRADPALGEGLSGLIDPMEQVALVRHFVQRGAEDLASLCGQVPAGEAFDDMRDACGRMSVRPHLLRPAPQIDSARATGVARTAAGPGWAALLPRAVLVNPFKDVSPKMAPCADSVLVSTCQHQAAQAAAIRGEARSTAAACMGVPPGTWRHECFFDAVKTMVEDPAPGRVPAAVSLCWGTAPGWLDLCLERAITDRNGGTLPPLIPSADAPSHPGWSMLRARAEAAHQALSPVDPVLADAAISRYWARVAAISVHKSAPPSMAAAGVLPDSAAPHFRAAVAWQRWQRSAGQDRQPEPPQIDAWTEDRAGEAGIRAVVHFYGDRRALAADPEIDALICKLEAAGRDDARGESTLQAAMAHPSALVRWTATRLIEKRLHPGSVSPGQEVRVDPAEERRLAQRRAALAAEIQAGD